MRAAVNTEPLLIIDGVPERLPPESTHEGTGTAKDPLPHLDDFMDELLQPKRLPPESTYEGVEAAKDPLPQLNDVMDELLQQMQTGPTTARRLSAEDSGSGEGSGETSLLPSPSPSPDADDECVDGLLTLVEGDAYCAITTDSCAVTDATGTGGGPERCTFRATEAVVVNTVEFDTERDFDYLTIAGDTYTGRRGPRNVLLTLGATFTWRSDRSTQR